MAAPYLTTGPTCLCSCSGAVCRSWRLFLLLSSLPALLTGLSLFWFPESPRYLLSRGRPDLALRSLQQVFATNTVRP